MFAALSAELVSSIRVCRHLCSVLMAGPQRGELVECGCMWSTYSVRMQARHTCDLSIDGTPSNVDRASDRSTEELGIGSAIAADFIV